MNIERCLKRTSIANLVCFLAVIEGIFILQTLNMQPSFLRFSHLIVFVKLSFVEYDKSYTFYMGNAFLSPLSYHRGLVKTDQMLFIIINHTKQI